MSEQEQPSGDSDFIDVDEAVEGESEAELGTELIEEQSEESTEEDIEEELDGVKVRGKKEALERLKSERLMQAPKPQTPNPTPQPPPF